MQKTNKKDTGCIVTHATSFFLRKEKHKFGLHTFFAKNRRWFFFFFCSVITMKTFLSFVPFLLEDFCLLLGYISPL